MQFKLLLLVVLIGLTGCDQVSKHFSNQTKLDDKISKIDKKTSDMKRMLEAHDKIISDVLYSLGELKMVNNLVEFQKDSKGLSVLKTNLGNFPMALKAMMDIDIPTFIR
ncbi:hypothetical protein [Legionella feeleii]|uniref:Lipoprotein n=1 Tax=Legionella feeleii TaxID=453 RepID=A0A0W0TKT5_9GAMM|nr:hypothetical protein [Legionella feeleii]KTC96211.1 hypothetical protein Lfee_2009 [Legionella feeleii]SPX60989.1 Uncharacterised protein [Legionella feeleii]